jgi:hypothetical protein
MKIFSGSENIFLGRLPKRASGTIKWPELFDETARLLSDFEVALDPHRRIDSLGMAERAARRGSQSPLDGGPDTAPRRTDLRALLRRARQAV